MSCADSRVTLTVTAGSAEVFDVVLRLYDGEAEQSGTILGAQRIAHIAAHGDALVRLAVSPDIERCGQRRLVAVAGQGLPIADERQSMPVIVDCARGRSE